MAAASTPTVTVGSRGRSRVASGQVWIYRQDVLAGPERDARDGGPALVLVTDERKRPLAVATWATDSPVALRILDRPSPQPSPRKRGEGATALAALPQHRLAALDDGDVARLHLGLE